MDNTSPFMSPIARAIWEDRYALRDKLGNLQEKDIFETFRRVAIAIAAPEKDPKKWESKFLSLMEKMLFCPAGRTLGNAGTEMSQLVNCFVIPFEDDSLEAIMKAAKNMALTEKFGGGVGFNYSSLRPEGSHIKGVNGHSCGVPGFIDMMSVISGVIEQGGSRRGANLGLLSIDHPDIWKFIQFKNENSWNFIESILTINDPDRWEYFKSQNPYKLQMYNISITITDEFIHALEEDEIWPLMWNNEDWQLYTVRYKSKSGIEKEFEVTANNENTAKWKTKRLVPHVVNGDIFEIVSKRGVKASELWYRLCYNAWANGCPGIINMSTTRKFHNGEYISPILAFNPCLTGETMVAVADGRVAVPIKQLAEEEKDVPVYCRNDNGKVTIRMMRHPRVTGINVPVMKVTLDDGSIFRATPDHEIFSNTRGYVRVKNLHIGESLNIMTRHETSINNTIRAIEGKKEIEGLTDYYWINKYNLEHRLIWEFYNGSIPKGFVVHHKNGVGKDNRSDNLCLKIKKDHDKLHAAERTGDNNPMRRAQTEWSEEKWQRYHKNMSKSVTGVLNGRFSGISNEKLFSVAVNMSKTKGRKISVREWRKYAMKNSLVSQFSGYRNDHFGSIQTFLDTAAEEAGVGGSGLTHAALREYKRFLRVSSESDLDMIFRDGKIVVRKICEYCKQPFETGYMFREQSYCNRKCSTKVTSNYETTREAVSKFMRKEGEKKRLRQIEAFNDFRMIHGRIPLKKEFKEFCKERKIPFRIPLKKELSIIKNTFKSWKDLKETALTHNHRVISIEPDGFETVYNGTVDEYHNFYFGHFPVKEKLEKNVVSYLNSRNCGEQPLSKYSACDLGSLVLSSFYKDGKMDYSLLKKATHDSVRFLDNVLDVCKFPLNEMKKASSQQRRIGLGTTGVHDLLIKMKLDYDSVKGREFTDEVLTFIRDEAYRASIELAKEKGPFPTFDKEKIFESEYIKRLPEDIRKAIAEHGLRNVCLLSQAPVGTTGALLGVSQGCEPWYSLAFDRHTNFGSYTDGCQEYISWRKEHPEDEIPSYFKTATQISPEDHVEMMAVFAKFSDSGVSKTVNLMQDATVEDVSKVYLQAMKKEIKGITIFREGCRPGVLEKKDDSDNEKEKPGKTETKKPEKIVTDSRVLPMERGNRAVGATTRVRMQDHNMYVTVNKARNGNLAEVFATVGECKKPNSHQTSGVEDSWAEGLAKMISLALRAGVTTESIIRNLKNIPSDKPVFSTIGDCETSESIPSPPHAIARVMEEELKYVYPNEIKSEKMPQAGKPCESCGSTNTVPKGNNCYDCKDCGNSGCGS